MEEMDRLNEMEDTEESPVIWDESRAEDLDESRNSLDSVRMVLDLDEEPNDNAAIENPVEKGPSVNDILALLAENNKWMGDALPWAYGLASVLERLCNKVKSLENENCALKSSLEFTQKEFKKQDTAIKENKGDIEGMEVCASRMSQVVGNHEVTLNVLEEKTMKLDTTQRANNLIFRGIPEDGRNTSDDCIQKTDDILERRMGLEPSVIKIDRCYRIGPNSTRMAGRSPRPRPILVQFNWNFNRAQVLEKSRSLYRSGVTVEEDFPIETTQKRATLNPILRKAKRTSYKVLICCQL